MGNEYQIERLIHEKEVKRGKRVSNGEIDTRKRCEAWETCIKWRDCYTKRM